MAVKKTPAKKKTSPKAPVGKAKKVSKAKSVSIKKTATASKSSSKKPLSKSSSASRKRPAKKASAKKTEKPAEKTEPKNTQAGNKRKMIISVIAILLIFFLAFAASKNFDFNPSDSSSSPVLAVNTGDTVSVNYIGSFPDGKVFDTSYESIAKDNDLYTEGRDYTPLIFVVGAGQMIKGFDNAVVGMALGETKTVTISPEDAYGASDPEMIIDIPTSMDRIMYIEREFDISSSDFDNAFGKEPVLDDIVGAMFPWNFTVKEIGSENITLEYMMEIGDTFIMPQTVWNSTVTEKNGTTLTILQNPEDGQVIQTLFGPASITISEDTINLQVDAEAGQEIMTPYGQGTVVSVSEESITFDLNPPMVGKTLIFEITVENVTKSVIQ